MNYNRRIVWILTVIYILLITLWINSVIVKANAHIENVRNRTSPIVFLKESMMERNQDVIEYIKNLNQARQELMNVEELIREKEIKRKDYISSQEMVQAVSYVEDGYSMVKEVMLTVSFYTGLESENGVGLGYSNAMGGKLIANQSMAAPRDIPFGSVLEIERYGTRIVDDRGKENVIEWLNDDKTHMKVDLYITPNKGEGDKQYWTRVNNMGVVEDVKAKLYVKE